MISIKNYNPKNERISDHILYYYFFVSEDPKTNKTFTHYPHYRNTINVYFDASVKITDSERTITHNSNSKTTTVLTNNVQFFKKANINGAFETIGIVFNTLGLNRFLKKDYASCFSKPVTILDNFWLDFNDTMDAIRVEKNLETRVNLLDSYFSEIYEGFEDDTLEIMVKNILDSKGVITVKQLEESSSKSRRTLLRLFQKHLGCSIKEFKRVVKFRYALDSYQQANSKPSLTELTYQNNYYDQSDFINHFKSLSGELPSKLFSGIEKVDQRDLYWKFAK